ncbi:transcriptional regulatory protein [Pseudooceanicola batsensis HTCC2597]|uniref:Transcriptional regulatory protein n=1 Tax=Pseudooceanicola batsensis (strain ATCC BAA-863 / DSM 15984 / KCTC 12145 / HTCC2597) TaxID=252305 RepID=A3U163_PSEBH|nr:sigma-54-dependent Fis family transcriptional regulator [Pseudooceanicola batsensis]EAQ02046.1 transcriptional regulatory protein [Pseudooceanicola batsensis HTCC2597]
MNGLFRFGAVVGSGMTAQAADSAGADYLLALNAGRFRVQGASSLTSYLPVRSANDWVFEFSEREILGRCKAPVFAGLSVSDPSLDVAQLVDRARTLGFAGVCNFPPTSLLEGRIATMLAREGLGFARELELVRAAARQDMAALAHVVSHAEAHAMAEAGATVICVNLGFTGGGTGVTTRWSVESAAIEIDRILADIPSGIDKLCIGGPITSPEEALAVTRISRVQGYIAGSTLDRFPLEQTLRDVAHSFKAIPRLATMEVGGTESETALIGGSSAMQEVRRHLRALEGSDVPVLIQGATGTGKTTCAKLLHANSPLGRRAPVIVDCPSLTAEAGSALLLGTTTARGALEQAGGSAVILEEVPALEPAHQGQLLRFSDEGVIQRIGELSPRKVEARIIATSSVALGAFDAFRRDLYYRLAAEEITLPPLRDRLDDIPELALHLGRQMLGGETPRFTNAALRILLIHTWPGNVRELRNTVRRAVTAADGMTIGQRHLNFLRVDTDPTTKGTKSAAQERGTLTERDWISEALVRNRFQRARTAQDLGMSTRTLYSKIKKYGLLP